MKDELREHYRMEATEERDERDFKAWLKGQDFITNPSFRDRGTDFCIGDRNVYPTTIRDDELNVIARSSIAMWQSGVSSLHDGLFVTEVKVHLPPAREELRDEIDAALDLPESTGVFYGTGALGGMPAPEGVVTPHIFHKEDMTYDTAREAIQQAIDAYVEVYDEGKKAIKKQPEEFRNE